MFRRIAFLYFLISFILSVPILFVSDPGFSMAGYWMLGLISLLIDVPMLIWLKPRRNRE
ncbi:MAG: hypothetical protein IJW29_00170 [Clostridia bacterium]|nr:hypothetical protein [Clostridia bacterium]